MKKVSKAALGVLIGAAVVGLLVLNIMITPLMNNLGAKKEMNRIKNTPLPEQTEIVETFYLAGNLNGNGNKMNFYGAVLIHSELSLEELEEHYSAYRKGKYDLLLQHQESQQLEEIERNFGFDDTIDADVSDGKYYLVYTWGHGIPPFNHMIDLRAN
jgi:hypothetical protein